MKTSALFSVILAVAAAQSFPPVDLSSTCAATLCPEDTICKEETNQAGDVRARCVGVKAGECPTPDRSGGVVGICANTCNTDSDCEGSDKCCTNPCGATTCQQPKPSCDTKKCGPGERCELQQVFCIRAPCYPVPTCVKDTNKDGRCPVPGPFEAGICANTCADDNDCKGSDKCCRNGCGATTCQAPEGLIPIPTKPSCATVRCGFGQKCVLQQVFCIRSPCYPQPVCMDIVSKPGQCRKPGPTEVGICASTCTYDDDCKGSDKCCKNACGATTCQSPQGLIPVPTKPSCDSVRCRSGQKCVLQKVLCFRAPCYPVPVCVDIKEESVIPETCNTVKCGAGEKCVMKPIPCFRAPCPSRPVCEPCPEHKPGVCPRSRFSFFMPYCRTRCRTDAHCPGAQKCCKSGYRSCCQDPEPEPTLTCATVDCKPDYTCVMKFQCDETGCSDRPLCEPVKRCPFYPAWINPHCVRQDTCSEKDLDGCPSGTLCCSTDCGRKCVKPM